MPAKSPAGRAELANEDGDSHFLRMKGSAAKAPAGRAARGRRQNFSGIPRRSRQPINVKTCAVTNALWRPEHENTINVKLIVATCMLKGHKVGCGGGLSRFFADAPALPAPPGVLRYTVGKIHSL